MHDRRLNEWREAIWRGTLTPAQRAELERWLQDHPEAQLDWSQERALARTLADLPDVPLSSNFTACVLQAVDAEVPLGEPIRLPFWRRFPILVRTAVAGGALAVAVGAFVQHERTQSRADLVRCLTVASAAAHLPGVEVLTDFDAIQRLGQSVPVDEDLYNTLTELASP